MGSVQRTITKTVAKMAASGQFALVETLNLVLYHLISSKFHAWITLIKLSLKFEYKFCPMRNNKMAFKMADFCQFAFVDTLIMYPNPKCRKGEHIVFHADPVGVGVSIGVLFLLLCIIF